MVVDGNNTLTMELKQPQKELAMAEQHAQPPSSTPPSLQHLSASPVSASSSSSSSSAAVPASSPSPPHPSPIPVSLGLCPITATSPLVKHPEPEQETKVYMEWLTEGRKKELIAAVKHVCETVCVCVCVSAVNVSSCVRLCVYGL